jgi:hypothetical protein
MQPLDPGGDVELLSGEVGARPDSRRTKSNLSRLCLAERHKSVDGLHTERRAHHQDDRSNRKLTDWREILERVVRQLRIHRRTDREGG